MCAVVKFADASVVSDVTLCVCVYKAEKVPTSERGKFPCTLRGRRWKTYGSCCMRTASMRTVSAHTKDMSLIRFIFQPWEVLPAFAKFRCNPL